MFASWLIPGSFLSSWVIPGSFLSSWLIPGSFLSSWVIPGSKICFRNNVPWISSLYVCMAIKYIIVLFVETPRKFITAKLSIRKPRSSSVLIISKSKDIKRVHSVKNAVFRTSHGFAKLTSFTRHQKQIKYSKKNLICQQPVPSLRFQSKL